MMVKVSARFPASIAEELSSFTPVYTIYSYVCREVETEVAINVLRSCVLISLEQKQKLSNIIRDIFAF